MDLEEEWRYVPNFPEYIVSNLGEVKKTGNKDSKPLYARLLSDGHLYVTLHVPGDDSWEGRRFRLSRIVAAAFLTERWRELLSNEVEHIDGDLHNCRLDNLRWVER